MLEHRQVWRGRIFGVDADVVRLPRRPRGRGWRWSGTAGRWCCCRCPMPSHVILVRQYRYAIDRWIWELPAGSLEEGEAPREGAVRECEEEVGLVPCRRGGDRDVLPDTRLLRRVHGLLPADWTRARRHPAAPPPAMPTKICAWRRSISTNVRAMIRRGDIVRREDRARTGVGRRPGGVPRPPCRRAGTRPPAARRASSTVATWMATVCPS